MLTRCQFFPFCLVLLTIQFGKPLCSEESEPSITSPSDYIPDKSRLKLGSIITEGINTIGNISSLLPTDGVTKICYGKYGCFTLGKPFGLEPLCRPTIMLPPLCPEPVHVLFYVWTKENPEIKHVVNIDFPKTITELPIRELVCAMVYITGYLGTGDMFHIRDLKDVFLQKTECIFISVDYSIEAHLDYLSAVSNAGMVGAITAHFLQQLMRRFNVGPERIHVVGHSLGAHIAGEVGKRIRGIGRITGLDPAKQLFEGCDATVRLNKEEALFVDIVHTDINGLGTKTASGHADIYVNGGYTQEPLPEVLSTVVPYDHLIAPFYFIDTVKSDCPYLAYQCDDQDNFERGKCAKGCGDDGSLCIPLGFRADQWKNHSRESPTLFFMVAQLNHNKTFCLYHYYVQINCMDNESRLWRYGRNKDKLQINLIGADGETGFKPANQHSIRYTTLASITTLITASNQIGQIRRVKLIWQPDGIVSPQQDCQTEPKELFLCKEKFDYSRARCLMCPFTVKAIYAKNLETSNSATFDGRNTTLRPNQVKEFSSR